MPTSSREDFAADKVGVGQSAGKRREPLMSTGNPPPLDREPVLVAVIRPVAKPPTATVPVVLASPA